MAKSRPAGKRDRLVAAAVTLMHERGVDAPTLAEIAHAAGVAPGNVYYYFKTRDDLVGAVVAARVEGIRVLLATLDELESPVDRLNALTDVWVNNKVEIARYGCPIGTLCAELTKRDERGVGGAVLFSTTIEWATEQFRQLGQAEPAALATTMVAIVQGAALLASTLQNPDLLTTEIGHLRAWIDRIAYDTSTASTDPHDRHPPRNRSTAP